MSKQTQLDHLFDEIKTFELPKKRMAGPKLVLGSGNVDAQVMFIGEAPGFYEAQQGLPFVGAAGKLLDKMLTKIDMDRSQVYIANLLKFRPPENRDPNPTEVKEYSPFLHRQIEIINPKVIITLGRFSLNFFLPDAKITKDHGKVFKYQNYFIYPVFHPAAALRDPERMKDLEHDFLKIPRLLEKLREREDNKTKKE